MSSQWHGRRSEDGYVAVVVAILISTLLLALAAVGVDTARWYVEAERVQRAADSAALAGVVYLPDNLNQAVVAARESARLNGFDDADPDIVVSVTYGALRSQLRVTVRSSIDNQFGSAIGVDRATIQRASVADYTSPAPMGSPCNVFGNEPLGGNTSTAPPNGNAAGASGPRETQIPKAYRDTGICKVNPNFWAVIEGPGTDKQNGDRYSTVPCTLTPLPTGCSGGKNAEAVHPEGYFFSVKVPKGAEGTPITLQLYDPAFFFTNFNCSSMPAVTASTREALNDYTTDSRVRYRKPSDVSGARPFCSGDFVAPRPRPEPSRFVLPTTSFTVREANDAQDPMQGAPYANCTTQFPSFSAPPTLNQLTKGHRDYVDAFARLFHQWVPLCTFTPRRSGDHYLQVRTNVALGGTERFEPVGGVSTRTLMWKNNSAVLRREGNTVEGEGVNSFSIRALSSAADKISVSGWSRMPMFQNVSGPEVQFNLLRVLPQAAGQSISFEFYDVADGADGNGTSGTVQVIPPLRADGTQPAPYKECFGALNSAPSRELRDCTVRVEQGTHNGQVQKMSIPIPSDYTCQNTQLTGCWFEVKIKLDGSIVDITTWNASLEGDPVRLIE